MTLGLVAALLIVGASGPVCGTSEVERSLLTELNVARRAAGVDSVAPHPTLCEIAQAEASSVAARGTTPTEAGHVTSMTSRLYRSGYAPHSWTEGSLVTGSADALLGQWRGVRPAWVVEAETGDFEHVGIGVDRIGDRLVVTLVLAITTRTFEWRRAEPLEDLRQVRELALAEVNRQRGAEGLGLLVGEPLLDAAAQRHAEDMVRRSYYDHRSPEGTSLRERIRATGYRGGGGFAENIAKGPFAPDEVVLRWMNSPGHRRNLLRPRSTEVGFGVAFGVDSSDEFVIVWVQVFSTR